MRKTIALVAFAALLAAGIMAGAAKKSTAKKGSAASSASKRGATAKKGTAAKKGATASSRKGSKRGRSKKTAARQTWRSRQLAPTPERYTEIQQALINKGYLSGTATGVWDQSSADALRRFQEEQNLEPTGKINSLSLIALGLGPKYDTATVAAPKPE